MTVNIKVRCCLCQKDNRLYVFVFHTAGHRVSQNGTQATVGGSQVKVGLRGHAAGRSQGRATAKSTGRRPPRPGSAPGGTRAGGHGQWQRGSTRQSEASGSARIVHAARGMSAPNSGRGLVPPATNMRQHAHTICTRGRVQMTRGRVYGQSCRGTHAHRPRGMHLSRGGRQPQQHRPPVGGGAGSDGARKFEHQPETVMFQSNEYGAGLPQGSDLSGQLNRQQGSSQRAPVQVTARAASLPQRHSVPAQIGKQSQHVAPGNPGGATPQPHRCHLGEPSSQSSKTPNPTQLCFKSVQDVGRTWLRESSHWHGQCSVKFKVVSYNVLADELLLSHRELYRGVEEWLLDWEYRKKNLLRELLHYKADVCVP